MLQSWLTKKLEERKADLLLRELSLPKAAIDFTSNDYLGLSRSAELSEMILRRLGTLGVHGNGATGSRLLSGNSSYVQQVEEKLAALFDGARALIFNSGYAANLAVLSSLPQRGDTILYDELSHACIKDGARLSLANKFSFRHNNASDLEQKLKKATGRIFVAAESIYSMDGDECPLHELIAIAKKYHASIILDEAHSTGVIGESGNGLAVSRGLHREIDVRVYTFGKAMGIHGAVVIGSDPLIQYLINFARPFIYTTALPPHSIASIDCAFDFLGRNIYLQTVLTDKVSKFKAGVRSISNRTNSNSAIQTAIFPGNDNVKSCAVQLQQLGFDVRPILSPTVARGTERLRICLHTFNENHDIETLTSLLKSMHLEG